MRDAEFDQLLEQFGLVIGNDDDAVASGSLRKEHAVELTYSNLPIAPIAANDNETIWPVFPFPEGWNTTH